MNVFHKFTRECLKKNKVRSIVTIIGITLSTAMVTAVIQAASSGISFLKNREIASRGAYHLMFDGLTPEETDTVLGMDEILKYSSVQEVGWAGDIGSTNPDKPYLLIEAIEPDLTELLAVKLISGRMPEAPDEILLPYHLSSNGGVEHQLGDALTLAVGKRVAAGSGFLLDGSNPFLEGEEEIVDTVSRTYRVVGFYQRFHFSVEQYSCPGYTALTVGEGTGPQKLFVSLKRPQEAYRLVQSRLKDLASKCTWHDDLIRLSGTFRSDGINGILTGVEIFLVILIGAGSILLIYNSFSISVSERTKQFGILKSVGATRKQIRHCVLYEAFLLCLVGIPLGILSGCAGIGVTLWSLQDAFAMLLGSDGDVRMKLVVSPVGLLVAVVVCLITTLISAWIPAERAIRVSAIEAIRQSNDVKIRSREVRTGVITRKLFGFEGMMAAKNFKRNKKRDRTTIISLFLSVTLFISASSLCAYISKSVEGYTAGSRQSDMEFWYEGPEADLTRGDEIRELLSGIDGVLRTEYVDTFRMLSVTASESFYTDQYLKRPDNDNDYGEEARVNLVFLDDESFRSICKEEHLDEKNYFQVDTPLALMYNQGVYDYQTEKGAWKKFSFQLLNKKALNRDFLLHLTPQEAEVWIPVRVGAFVENRTLVLSGNYPFLIYPYSMRDAVLGQTGGEGHIETLFYGLKVRDFKATYQLVKKTLEENGFQADKLYDLASQRESDRMLVTVINVFSYGFIILISLIAMANVFNTIYTNIGLRRREFAMLSSVGLTGKGLRKMMNYECIIYGAKGLMFGLPASLLATYCIWRIIGEGMDVAFFVPWYSVAIAVGSVFAVVFATMLYAMSKIKADNTIDALKNENL